MLTRVAAKVAQRIILGWARLLALPGDSPIAPAVQAALAHGGGTWLQDAAAVAQSLGVGPPPEALLAAAEGGPEARRCAVRRWARSVVIPRVREHEREWFCEQLAKLNETGLLPIATVLPLRQEWPADLRWASWGQTQWRFHRAWCMARVTSELPTAIWGRAATRMPITCALCGREAAGLHHLLARCLGAEALRAALVEEWAPPPGLAEWVLMDTDNLGELAAKVRFLGLSCAALVHAACARAGAGQPAARRL